MEVSAAAAELRTSFVNIPILVYHSVMPHKPGQTPLQREYDVDPDVFDRQLKLLQDRGYAVVPLADLYRRLVSGAALPDKSAVLAFDDGWENQYTYAFPLLRKYGVTATFFIFTDGVGKKSRMNWEQIADLEKAGMTIGAHTMSHRPLTSISDPAELAGELSGSKRILEEKLGVPVDFFAYPDGVSNAAAREAVQNAGFKAARAFQGGLLNDRDRLFGLRSVIATDDMAQFEAYLAGIYRNK